MMQLHHKPQPCFAVLRRRPVPSARDIVACGFSGDDINVLQGQEAGGHAPSYSSGPHILSANPGRRSLGTPFQNAFARRGAGADVRVDLHRSALALRKGGYSSPNRRKAGYRGSRMRGEVQIAGYCRQNISY